MVAATSTGSLAFYDVSTRDDAGDESRLRHHATLQLFQASVIVTSVAPHPKDATLMAVTLSTGDVKLVKLAAGDGSSVETSTYVHTHSLEAWTVAFSLDGTGLFSGGDDSVLSYQSMVDDSNNWKDRRAHGAGVTAILPLTNDITVTGSYDDHVRVLSTPSMGKRIVLAESNLEGGVWRLKLIDRREEPGKFEYDILASCMHAGTRVLRVSRVEDAPWQVKVVAKFEEHKSMNYGSDVKPGEVEKATSPRSFISTSFYDRLICYWKY